MRIACCGKRFDGGVRARRKGKTNAGRCSCPSSPQQGSCARRATADERAQNRVQKKAAGERNVGRVSAGCWNEAASVALAAELARPPTSDYKERSRLCLIRLQQTNIRGNRMERTSTRVRRLTGRSCSGCGRCSQRKESSTGSFECTFGGKRGNERAAKEFREFYAQFGKRACVNGEKDSEKSQMYSHWSGEWLDELQT